MARFVLCALFTLGLLVSPVCAARLVSHHERKNDCFHKIPVSLSTKTHVAKLAAIRKPGAGLGEITPFETVLKDGFSMTKCINDYMFLHGDKFGDNKHEYMLGGVSNVSIVHYNDWVAKQDRKEMTHEVCFDFCRTVPDMLYFGITNGRSCYCEPFFKPMEADSSECDEVCDGDNANMCGGKVKSSIFEMHSCNDAPLVLGKAAVLAGSVQGWLADVVDEAKTAANKKNALAQQLQKSLGKAGDLAASDQMQDAKVSAGKLLHLAEETERLSNKMSQAISRAKSMTGLSWRTFADEVVKDSNTLDSAISNSVRPTVNFKEFKVADEADELLKTLNDLTPKTNTSAEELQAALLASGPHAGGGLMVDRRYGSGSCDIDEGGCVTFKSSPNANSNYDWNYCSLLVEGTPKITVRESKFKLGQRYGYMYASVNGRNKYSYLKNSLSFDGEKIGDGGDRIAMGSYAPFELQYCASYGSAEAKSTAGIQYYSLMYFVDKEFANVPSTCSGTSVGQPIYGKNYHTCATACDHDVHGCKGFFYYPSKSGSLCFLLSDFKTATYWTGCDSGSSFLQKRSQQALEYKPLGPEDEPEAPICVAKLSEFNGLSLKPEGGGKCKHCLKDLKHADRCYA